MDPRKVLGVDENATRDEIHRAYLKMALKYHPDRGGDVWVFQRIREAYDVLTSTRSKRRAARPNREKPAEPPQPSDKAANSPADESSPASDAGSTAPPPFPTGGARSRWRSGHAGEHSRERLPLELAKVILGGLAGIVVAICVLWFGFGKDPFGVAHLIGGPAPRGSSELASGSPKTERRPPPAPESADRKPAASAVKPAEPEATVSTPGVVEPPKETPTSEPSKAAPDPSTANPEPTQVEPPIQSKPPKPTADAEGNVHRPREHQPLSPTTPQAEPQASNPIPDSVDRKTSEPAPEAPKVAPPDSKTSASKLSEKRSASAVVYVNNVGVFEELRQHAKIFGDREGYYWLEVPAVLKGTYFFKHVAAQQGVTEFVVTRSGTVLMATTTRWEKSGVYGKEHVTREQLESEGWQQIATMRSFETKDRSLDWVVFARDCRKGESFAYRTEKYIAPVLIVTPPNQGRRLK